MICNLRSVICNILLAALPWAGVLPKGAEPSASRQDCELIQYRDFEFFTLDTWMRCRPSGSDVPGSSTYFVPAVTGEWYTVDFAVTVTRGHPGSPECSETNDLARLSPVPVQDQFPNDEGEYVWRIVKPASHFRIIPDPQISNDCFRVDTKLPTRLPDCKMYFYTAYTDDSGNSWAGWQTNTYHFAQRIVTNVTAYTGGWQPKARRWNRETAASIYSGFEGFYERVYYASRNNSEDPNDERPANFLLGDTPDDTNLLYTVYGMVTSNNWYHYEHGTSDEHGGTNVLDFIAPRFADYVNIPQSDLPTNYLPSIEGVDNTTAVLPRHPWCRRFAEAENIWRFNGGGAIHAEWTTNAVCIVTNHDRFACAATNIPQGVVVTSYSPDGSLANVYSNVLVSVTNAVPAYTNHPPFGRGVLGSAQNGFTDFYVSRTNWNTRWCWDSQVLERLGYTSIDTTSWTTNLYDDLGGFTVGSNAYLSANAVISKLGCGVTNWLDGDIRITPYAQHHSPWPLGQALSRHYHSEPWWEYVVNGYTNLLYGTVGCTNTYSDVLTNVYRTGIWMDTTNSLYHPLSHPTRRLDLSQSAEANQFLGLLDRTWSWNNANLTIPVTNYLVGGSVADTGTATIFCDWPSGRYQGADPSVSWDHDLQYSYAATTNYSDDSHVILDYLMLSEDGGSGGGLVLGGLILTNITVNLRDLAATGTVDVAGIHMTFNSGMVFIDVPIDGGDCGVYTGFHFPGIYTFPVSASYSKACTVAWTRRPTESDVSLASDHPLIEKEHSKFSSGRIFNVSSITACEGCCFEIHDAHSTSVETNGFDVVTNYNETIVLEIADLHYTPSNNFTSAIKIDKVGNYEYASNVVYRTNQTLNNYYDNLNREANAKIGVSPLLSESTPNAEGLCRCYATDLGRYDDPDYVSFDFGGAFFERGIKASITAIDIVGNNLVFHEGTNTYTRPGTDLLLGTVRLNCYVASGEDAVDYKADGSKVDHRFVKPCTTTLRVNDLESTDWNFNALRRR